MLRMVTSGLSILKWAFQPGQVEKFIDKASKLIDKSWKDRACNIVILRKSVYASLAFSLASGTFAIFGTRNSQIANRACIALTYGGMFLTIKAIQNVYEAARPLHNYILKK